MPSPRLTPTLTASLDYADSGISVIPLMRRDKKPAIEWRPFQRQRASPDQLTGWFNSGVLNVGIVGGAISGDLTIIDFDSHDAYDWWIDLDMERWLLPCVTTAHGKHVYIRLQQWPGNKRDTKRRIDIRGEGGYVVAPPSIHPSGAEYKWTMGGTHKIPTFGSLADVGLDYLVKPVPEPQTYCPPSLAGAVPYSILPFVRLGTMVGNRDRKAYWCAMQCKDAHVPQTLAIDLIAQGLSKSQPDRDPVEWAQEKVRSAYGGQV